MSNQNQGHPLPSVINPPRKCHKIYLPDNSGHIAVFLAKLTELSKWHNWERDSQKNAARVADVWKEVTNQFLNDFLDECDDCDDNCPECENCYEYPPSADFIEWSPTDPFGIKKPTVSKLYQDGAWKISQNDIPFVISKGDVYTNPFLLFGSISDLNPIDAVLFGKRLADEGLPRFKIRTKGAKEVEIHFRTAIQGGWILITVDGKVETSAFMNLQGLSVSVFTDWLEVLSTVDDFFNLFTQGTAKNDFIVEYTFDDEGEHYIDVTFLPIPQYPDFWNSGFGGIVQKIVICGKPQPIPPPIVKDTGDGLEIVDPTTGEVIKIIKFNEVASLSEFSECCDDCDDECEETEECDEC